MATHTHANTHTEPALATYTATRASYIAKKAFFHKQPKKASHTHIDGRADRILWVCSSVSTKPKKHGHLNYRISKKM